MEIKQDNEFQKQLLALQEKFLEGLPDRLAEINQAAQAVYDCAAGSATTDALKGLETLAHKLAGTSGAFGESEIGNVAASLELLVRSQVAGSEQPDFASDLKPVWQIIAELEQAIARRLATDDAAAFSDDASAPGNSGKARRVLIIQEEVEQATKMALGLTRFGHRVKTLFALDELEAMLERFQPEIIFLDVEFQNGPGNGARRLQESKEKLGLDCPVIIASSRSDFRSRLSSVQAGAEAHILKPVAVADAVEIIAGRLDLDKGKITRAVLVADKGEETDSHLQILAEAGISASHCEDPDRLLDLLEEVRPDALLLDRGFSACDVTDLTKVLRQWGHLAAVPLLYVTGPLSDQERQGFNGIGVDSFLTRPLDNRQVREVIRSQVSRFRSLRDQMTLDSLTGLLNHANAKLQLSKELARAIREKQNLTICKIDVDNLQEVNETHGHQIGDQVLKSLASLLSLRLRESDIVGRLAGQEFLVIMTRTPGPRARDTIEALRLAFEKTGHLGADGSEFRLTFSAGVADFPSYKNTDDLMLAAEQALLRAKNEGRNRVLFADALSRKSAGPHLQISAATGNTVSAEFGAKPIDAGNGASRPPAQLRKALVLDDDADMCELISLLGRRFQFDFQSLTDPVKFADIYDDALTLIVLDLNMPVVDGVEILRQLGKLGSKADIILISGYESGILQAAINLADRLGLNVLGALSKPLQQSAAENLFELARNSAENGHKEIALAVRPQAGTSELPSAQELRRAIAEEKIEAFFQPKVKLFDRSFCGAEVLSRWNHETKGFIPSDYFIALAEESGLIDDLTRLTLRKVCTFVSEHREILHRAKIAINISEASLKNLSLPDELGDILHEHSLSPDKFVLEITETSLTANLTEVLDVLTRLRLRGFRMSIDDFGTGHSSLERLHDLPFNEIKIDKTFVSSAHTNEKSRIIVKNTVELARSLGLNVVAEGAESEEHLEMLMEFGCDDVQGYCISKPLSASNFDKWLCEYAQN